MPKVDLVSAVTFAEKVTSIPGVRCVQVDGRENEKMTVTVFLASRNEVVSLDVWQAAACSLLTSWQQKFECALDICLAG